MKFNSEQFRRSIQAGFIAFMILEFVLAIFGDLIPAGMINFCRQFGFDPRQSQWVAVFTGIIITASVYVRYAIRQSSLRSDLTFQGFLHQQDVLRTDLGEWADLEVFNNWYKAENGYVGRSQEEPVTMVDFTTVAESEEGSTFASKTVFLLLDQAGQIPDFNLQNRTFFSELMVALFAGGKHFMPIEQVLIPTRISSESKRLVEEFNRYYYCPVASDNVSCRILSEELLSCLTRNPGWSVECKEGRMALWNNKRITSAEARQDALKQVLEIKQALCAAAQKNLTAQISGSPLFKIHEIKAGGGGSLGLFGGFILGGFIAMSLFTLVALRMPVILRDHFMLFWFLMIGICLYGVYYGIFGPRRWRIARLYKSHGSS